MVLCLNRVSLLPADQRILSSLCIERLPHKFLQLKTKYITNLGCITRCPTTRPRRLLQYRSNELVVFCAYLRNLAAGGSEQVTVCTGGRHIDTSFPPETTEYFLPPKTVLVAILGYMKWSEKARLEVDRIGNTILGHFWRSSRKLLLEQRRSIL